MDTASLLTASQVARLTGKSKSQVNRDASSNPPKLRSAITVPGYRGARLFDPRDVASYQDDES